jgi:hypothetical protein
VSHQHFCYVAGHYWQCEGTALRGGDAEPSVCVCVCGLPLEGFDHSGCHDPVELLACPEHWEEGRQRIEEARKEHDRRAAESALMRSGRERRRRRTGKRSTHSPRKSWNDLSDRRQP